MGAFIKAFLRPSHLGDGRSAPLSTLAINSRSERGPWEKFLGRDQTSADCGMADYKILLEA
jgi:hypothetical protein